MTKEKLTACINCSSHKRTGGENTWYYHYCKAVSLPPEFDSLTGIFKDPEFEHCRDVNKNGHCEHFVEKRGIGSRIFGKKTNNRKDVK